MKTPEQTDRNNWGDDITTEQLRECLLGSFSGIKVVANPIGEGCQPYDQYEVDALATIAGKTWNQIPEGFYAKHDDLLNLMSDEAVLAHSLRIMLDVIDLWAGRDLASAFARRLCQNETGVVCFLTLNEEQRHLLKAFFRWVNRKVWHDGECHVVEAIQRIY